MKVKSESEVAQLCPILSDPMDCSPPGSAVHGIFQARVLERGAIAFSAEHATISQNIPRLTKAAVSQPSPSMQHPLVPILPLTGDPLLFHVSRDGEKIGLVTGVAEGE
ncbi:unnamed protein product [Rangifer tarandus platyrhynchus]|uniref:Uncharacterized protein n=1 Tax=Rangifer tarandus platyrhynchus TaxID=3082113 RepID=A0ABN8ZSH1_RANTA|nr:unnamed protein product [Rangifer tarandus platyrhynchus]